MFKLSVVNNNSGFSNNKSGFSNNPTTYHNSKQQNFC